MSSQKYNIYPKVKNYKAKDLNLPLSMQIHLKPQLRYNAEIVKNLFHLVSKK